MVNSKNKTLLALTTAALGLPGLSASSGAIAAEDRHSFSYRHSKYTEKDLAASASSTGEAAERYDISINQFRLLGQLGSDTSVSLDYVKETMSGASPWYVARDDNGAPIQVMSGATIEEERVDLSLGTSIEKGRFVTSLNLANSTENDYESNSVSLSETIWLNNKNSTLDFGVSLSNDEITPTQDSSGPSRINFAEKESISISLGFSQVITQNTLFGSSISYASYEGYLSDPYKLALVASEAVADSRPSEKNQTNVDLKLRHYVKAVSGALHLDYRFYTNNWEINSHTVDLGWYQNLGSWQFNTAIRWYDQTAAIFYRNFYNNQRADGYYSSDYRLSAYGAVGFSIGLRKSFELADFVVSYENYNSGKGRDSNMELNPGLVDFAFISAGVDYKF